jgi:hypothetical protein
MSDWNNSNIDLQKARTIHTMFFYYFNGQSVTVEGSIPDIVVDLTVCYQRGTLIVDDPVTVSGVAVVNTSIPQHVRSIAVHFQNSQAYPIRQDSENITEGIDLLLEPTQNSSRFMGTATMVWSLEGVYNPYFAITYDDSTGVHGTPLAISRDVAITVYPKEQLAQIVTSNVSMILTISVYLLTLVGTGSLILSLWDRKQSPQKGKNNTENTDSSTKVTNNQANRGIARKSKSGNAEPDNK